MYVMPVVVSFSPQQLLKRGRLRVENELRFCSSMYSINNCIIPSSIGTILLFVPLPNNSTVYGFDVLTDSGVKSMISCTRAPV